MHVPPDKCGGCGFEWSLGRDLILYMGGHEWALCSCQNLANPVPKAFRMNPNMDVIARDTTTNLKLQAVHNMQNRIALHHVPFLHKNRTMCQLVITCDMIMAQFCILRTGLFTLCCVRFSIYYKKWLCSVTAVADNGGESDF